jgi:prepilin-type N-terminal cleavage/methylation domain-containing protein
MPSRSLPSARSDSGFSMIEVIVSAAVLAIVALAVLSGVDGAQSATGREKARSIAASLAEKDQERLRSTQFAELVKWTTAPPAPVSFKADGVDYSVASEAEWKTDSTTGTNNCTSTTSEAKYLRVASTVTSTVVGAQTAPVKVSSLIAPSVQYSATHGSLGVKVVDRTGTAGVNGNVVSTSGAGSYTGTTNSDGCVVFTDIPIGTYDVTLNQPGYVGRRGDQLTLAPDQEVVSGSITVASISYDLAGAATATIETYPPNATSTTTAMASLAPTISAANSTEVGLVKTYPTTPTPTAGKLFPFPSKYVFFTGSCGTSNPSTYDTVNGSSYWGATPAPPGQLQILPTQTLGVTVRQPPLLVNLPKRSGNNNVTATDVIKVVAIPQAYAPDTCVSPSIPLKLNTWSTANGAPSPAGVDADGWVGRGMVTVGGKSVPEAGVPFGRYKLCFEDDMVNPPKTFTYSSYDNFKPYPGPTNAVVASGSWTTGFCP